MSFDEWRPSPKPEPRKKKQPKPPKQRNEERREREFARAYHSKERVEFVASLPCIVSGCKRGPRDNAHVTAGAMGWKSDYTNIAPACRPHHTRLDTHPEGREGFEGEFYVDLAALAADTERLWQHYCATGETPHGT